MGKMMKRQTSGLIALIFCSLLLMPLITAAEITVNADSTILHSGPSLANRVVTTLYRGTSLIAKGENTDWLEVETFNGQRGWVVAEAVTDQKTAKQSAGSTSRYALVIGNSHYKNAPLKNPVNDATDMAQLLTGLGFQVTLLLDTTQKETITHIRNFTQTLTRTKGIGLFYYAGHGMQIKGKNYLIPTDANIEEEYQITYEGIDVGRVLEGMELAENRTNIVILDACRNNPFTRSFRSTNKGLAQMDAPSGTLIAYATAPGSVAAEGYGRNGLYTKHLLKEMSTPNLPIESALKRVRANVMAETNKKQVPWESSSLVGEFYFAGTRGLLPKRRSPEEHLVINGDLSIPEKTTESANPWYGRWYVWTAAAIVTAIIISCSGGGDGGTAGTAGDGGGC